MPDVTAAFAIQVLVGLACLVAGRRIGRHVFLLGALGPLIALVPVLSWMAGGQPVVVETFEWLPALGLTLDYRLDGFSALMVGLIGGIGILVFLYSWSYFSPRQGLERFAFYLVVFAASMFGLVVADNLILLFVFWELTSVMSYLLIGFQDDKADARSSALQALLVTGLGGLVMLAGLILLAQVGGTYSMSGLLADPPMDATAGVALGMILVGAFTKSAQFPFHFWLPGAMAAPTPVSAYLHSATMVKGGIYLVARLAPVYAPLIPWWRPVLAAVGLTTMVVGGWRALSQTDLKLLLAQGTVSQLGFIMVLVGWGSPGLMFAGVAMIFGHAVFKGALFMVAGIIDHQAHTRDIRKLSGLRRKLPGTFRLAVVATASMMGLPPLLGFLTKESALEALVGSAPWMVTGLVTVGSMLTVAYGLRFLHGTFARKAGVEPTVLDVPSGAFQAPAAVLASLTIVGGLLAWLPDRIVGVAAEALDPAAAGNYLALWHGFGLPLLLSGAAVVGGWAIWRAPLRRVMAVTRRAPDGARVYARTLSGLTRIADRVTAIVQNGSLPVYLAVILSTAVMVPGVLMAMNWRVLPEITLAESPVQAVTAVLVVVAAIAMTLARRRIGAVLLLGAVGYGVAVLFVIQGAPDLALTQLLIETLFLALFVVVLSRFPDRFEVAQSQIRKVSRITVSILVGAAAMGLSAWALAGRVGTSLAPEFMARAEPEGGGRNVVNVILTDFRALDTLGEITVLVLAAMGAISLVRARLPKGSAALATPPDPMPASRRRFLSEPPMILDVVVDVVLRTAVVFSLFLLFSGHNAPGGGFIGGLVAGICLVLAYIVGGEDRMIGLVRARADQIFGVGLFIAVMVGGAGYIWGTGFFDASIVELTVPVLGQIKATSALVFDIGVFGVVLGLSAALFGALGDDKETAT